MPILVNEIIIRAIVAPEAGAAAGASAAGGAADQEALVAACVEQVLEILKEKQER